MATIAERILKAIRYAPLNDDLLALRLGVAQRQTVNQTARRLEAQGRLRRYVGPEGKIVNALVDAASAAPVPRSEIRTVVGAHGEPITEDEVKAAVRDHLATDGFDVVVAWGRVRG